MLTLPIKKKWFDMILSGEKKEEYREIKPYYNTRIGLCYDGTLLNDEGEERDVLFRNGYGKNAPSFIATCTVSLGTGKAEWGAEPGKKYFVLHILKVSEVLRQ